MTRALALACAALALAACSAPVPKKPAACSIGGRVAPAPRPVRAFGPGENVTGTWQFTDFDHCAQIPENPWATVELIDPQGRPVAIQATKPEYVDRVTYPTRSIYWATDLSFTLGGMGLYHLTLTFEPGVGMLREDLWVVNDRRSIEPSIITLPYDDCIHLERTLRGTFACQRPSGGTDLKAAVIRDGGVLATFAEARLATAGNAIWISSDSALSRGLDTGDGSLEMSPPVATGFYGPESFAATEDAVLRQHVDSRPQIADSFQLFELDGGALTLTAELSVSMSEQVTAMVFSRDAGTALIGAAGRWARVPLTSGASSVSLNWAGGSAIYRHGAALWVRLDDSNWHLIPADPAQAEISFNAPFGWVDPTSRSSTTNLDPGINADGWPMLRPMVNGLLFDRDQVVVPTFTPEGVLFSLYKAPQDAQIIEISQGQLRAIRGFEQLSWPIEP